MFRRMRDMVRCLTGSYWLDVHNSTIVLFTSSRFVVRPTASLGHHCVCARVCRIIKRYRSMTMWNNIFCDVISTKLTGIVFDVRTIRLIIIIIIIIVNIITIYVLTGVCRMWNLCTLKNMLYLGTIRISVLFTNTRISKY